MTGVNASSQIICSDTPSQNALIVFVTSSRVSGSMGGINGADSICNTAAHRAGIKGEFRAWLSDLEYSPATRWNTSHGLSYIRTDGATVASSWAQLTSGSLMNPINRNEYGGTVSTADNGGYAWSNTTSNGTLSNANPTSGHCYYWTLFFSYPSTYYGVAGSINSWATTTQLPCMSSARLYCFQQPKR
jgi:hypothetical protein